MALAGVFTVLFSDFFLFMAYLGWVMALWIIFMHGFELHERATHRHSFMQGVKKSYSVVTGQ
ncbi:hypothetical protein QW180_03755 [Vibrio sinaloensis]|nr:hypothetical protein [Vibrio sinaloensis]